MTLEEFTNMDFCLCDKIPKIPGVVAWACSSRYCKNRVAILNEDTWEDLSTSLDTK